MPTIIDPGTLEFRKDPTALPQFDLLTLSPRLSKITGSKHFFFDIRQLDPGKYSFPYHFHRNSEELMMIISGSMTVRTATGFETAHKGQILFFETGETSAHQFFNHGTEPCVYLDIRTTLGLDVTEYPDSGKIGILPKMEMFEKKDQVGYNTGEEDVEEVWKRLRK